MFRVKYYFAALCLIAWSLLLPSCSDPDVIGLDLQPSSEQPGLFKTDSFTINAFTAPEDSLISWGTVKNSIEAPTLYAGHMIDPLVGETNAGFVSQVRLSNTVGGFDGVTDADSVVLSFAYKGIFGDTNALHTFHVYKLDQTLYSDSLYYTGRQYAKGSLVGTLSNFKPALNDSVKIDTITSAPQIRIKLNDEFGDSLLAKYIADPTAFASTVNFQNYFKGFVVEDDVNGAIVTFVSNSAINLLTLYYNHGKSYKFLIDGNTVRMSYFSHNYLPQNTDNIADNQMIVQSTAGLKDSIIIPDLSKLYNEGPVSVNSAILVIKADESATNVGNFVPHSNLLVLESDSIGRNSTIIDASESTSGYYGGTYDATNKEYRFNIARHVQRTLNKLVKGEKDYGLFLVAGGSTTNAQRTVLQGNTIKLIVTYTKVNP